MVDRGELLRDYRVSPLLPREEPLLPLVLRDLVLGLQLIKSLHHPRDEGLVLAHLLRDDFSMPLLLKCERH